MAEVWFELDFELDFELHFELQFNAILICNEYGYETYCKLKNIFKNEECVTKSPIACYKYI